MVDFQEIPLISNMQKLVLYETKARFYVVGSNNEKTKFRVLKIHRNEPRELVIEDDMVEYTADEVHKILAMIESGNRPKSSSSKGNSGLFRSVSAFGIAGFVRFLEGYYMILITKRHRVALIGPHTIYKVEDTCMLYIPNIGTHYMHPDESRYVKMFQNVDLSSNFYFSYCYDLTHSLQYNMTPLKIFASSFEATKEKFYSSTDNAEVKKNELKEKSTTFKKTADTVYGVKNKPCSKFVWNAFLQKHCEDMMHPDWVIHIIHGFIGQVNICVFGKPIFVTLIARRSSQFAGTRFLKRGANCMGSVANEVETEQIVHDASVTFLKKACVSSFVQLRGSIPLFWSQDISKMVPKPQIVVDQADPYAYVAGQHFNDVIKRFGSPMIVLNLVKMREKRRHESILTKEFNSAISYLNQFLPPIHNIQYIGFDMAGVSKKKDSNVMERLGKIAKYCIKRTGFYFHSPQGSQDELWKSDQLKGIQGVKTSYGKCQTGVIRTNCVDCLDRTNTAQFAVGKCALGYQLYAMGIISNPNLEYDTDCVRMLEELYEDQGNTLALQYGGSQLVHRIKGYRKIATWTYNSRDLVQTISRYYSNAFSDAEKQQSINLFLGIFTPNEACPNLWELPTDYYLHNLDAAGKYPLTRKSYCQWWDTNVPFYLPMSLEEAMKGMDGEVKIAKKKANDECVDEFYEYYRPYELTFLDDLFSFSVTHSIRNLMPKHATDYSPFSQRLNLDRPLEDPSGNGLEVPVSSKQDSAGSNIMTLEESASSSESDEMEGDVDLSDSSYSDNSTLGSKLISFKDIFPTTQAVYDFSIILPSKRGMWMYDRHAKFGESYSQPSSSPLDKCTKRARLNDDLYEISTFKLDSIYKVELPPINKYSDDIYSAYVWRSKHGAGPPTAKDMDTYKKYNNYQLNTMYQTHKTYPGNNRFQDYLERRLTDLHYHGFPYFGKIKHNLLLFIISISFISLLPFVHIAIIYKLIWVPDKAEVDRSGCTCSCFDTVFRGSYENPGTVLYKHVYFNSTVQTFKIWIITLFFILLTYESIKYLYKLLWPQCHIRWNMFVLYFINIYPHYYSWWSIFNYYNEDFYIYFNHHIYFMVTEIMATGIVLNMCNAHNQMSHWKMLCIIIISTIHILVSSLDQFITHIFYAHGTTFQNARNIALMMPDIMHIVICMREIVKLHKSADNCLSVNNYKEEFGLAFVLICLGTLFGKLV